MVGRAENAQKQGVNEEIEAVLIFPKLLESSQHSENILPAFILHHLPCHSFYL